MAPQGTGTAPTQVSSAQHLVLQCSLEAAVLLHIPAIPYELCTDQPQEFCVQGEQHPPAAVLWEQLEP